jgi:hypothetical protein
VGSERTENAACAGDNGIFGPVFGLRVKTRSVRRRNTLRHGDFLIFSSEPEPRRRRRTDLVLRPPHRADIGTDEMLDLPAQFDAPPLARSLLGADGASMDLLSRAPELGGAIAIVLGVVLLAAGARVLSTTVVIACASAFGIGAAVLARGADAGEMSLVAGVPVPALAGIAGCAVGALLGLALMRLAIGAATSATFAALALLGTGTFLMAQGVIASPPEAGTPATAVAKELGQDWLASKAGLGAASARETPGTKVAQAADGYARGYWNSLAPQARSTLLLATIIGGVVGLALGTLMPGRAASLVTALCGAGGAILGARILTTPNPAAMLEPGPIGPAGWLCIWIGLTLMGMWMQSRLASRPTRELTTARA